MPGKFQFLLKADDDVFVDVRQLYRAVREEEMPKNFIMGNVISKGLALR